MKTNLYFSFGCIVFSLAFAAQALPTYDDFSTYGPPGTLLGGNTAPSGESWISYTNVTIPEEVTGSNVYITNYFVIANDTLAPNIPVNFPGPNVSNGGTNTATNSVWTPGYMGVNAVQGGVGACLQFDSIIPNVPSNRIYVSFYVDVPLVYSSGPQGDGDTYGQGQSEGWGWSAGILESSELPSPNSSTGQNVIPTIFQKFNARASAASSPTGWKPGVGYSTSTTSGLISVGSGLSAGTIHFVVLDCEFLGGTNTDTNRIWLDPAANSFGGNTQPSGSSAIATPTASSLTDAAGFFFLAYCENNAALPPSGMIFNSLRIGTNWAYVTGGPQFLSYGPATTNIASGQTLVINSTATAAGVPSTYAWANSSGPLTLGTHFTVGPTGALTINNVQAGDADTYTLQVSTPITTENSVTVPALQTVVTVTSPPSIVSENASNIGLGQFLLNFTGPSGSAYRIWSTTDVSLSPVTNTWTLVTNGTFASGTNTMTDMTATNAAQFYTITVP